MDIPDWRKKIDAIDRDLVRLLNERARCVAEIGEIKRVKELAIQDANREHGVLENAVDANKGQLENDAVRRVFQQIIQEGRHLERRLFEKAKSEPRT
jgi:chorismate mutase